MFSFCLFKSCEVFFNVLNKNGVHYGFYVSLNFSKFPSHICSFCVFGPVSARSYKIGVVIIGWLDGCLVGWLVGWLAGCLAVRIFVIFCINVEKSESRIFEKNSWFGDFCENVSKLAQNQTLWYFYFIFGFWPEVSNKYDLQFEWNLFFRKFAIWRYLISKSSKNCPNWVFLPFSRLCIVIFPWFIQIMIGGSDVYLFSYNSLVQSLYSCYY